MTKALLAALATLFLASNAALADWPGDRNSGGGNDPPHQTPADPDKGKGK
jgi:hypothetical protein